MRRVAYLTGRSYRGMPLPPGVVPALEARGLELVRAAGEESGIVFDVVYWDETSLPERGYEAAIIRTCWDYHERPEVFQATLEAHERAGLKVYNGPDVVRWNSRKTYLKDLGASAIETVWAEHVDASIVEQAFETLQNDEIVLKPQVGAGSIATVRLKRGAWSDEDLRAGPPGAAPGAMRICVRGRRARR